MASDPRDPTDDDFERAMEESWRNMSECERASVAIWPWMQELGRQLDEAASPLYRYQQADNYTMPNHRLAIRLAMGYEPNFVPVVFVVRRDDHADV